jgi:HEAT repeat protein
MRKVSVLIRVRNEATFLEPTLRAVRAQRLALPVEIVCADNGSSDGSEEIAKGWADTMTVIDDYRPGAALNRLIDLATGDVLVPLSAHAVPANNRWLSTLIAHLGNPRVLGIYGAQHYQSNSRFLDKRDLDIFTDPRPRSEFRDSDFWNANSAFLRRAWAELPFDEETIELEDHFWTKRLLADTDRGRFVRYEPSARVYHYGHTLRNDRTFLPPGAKSPSRLVDSAIEVLSCSSADWADVMMAGMTIGSLSGRIGLARAIPALSSCLLEHPDFDVRWRMAGALGRTGLPQAAPPLVRGLSDPSFYVRDECAWALARLGGPATSYLTEALAGLAETFRPFGALALAVSADPAARPLALDALAALIESDNALVSNDAIYFLGEAGCLYGRLKILRAVTNKLHHQDALTVRAAAWTWGSLVESNQDLEGRAIVRDLLTAHPCDLVRAECVTALSRANSGPDVFAAALSDGAGVVRHAAMEALRLAEGFCDLINRHPYDDDFGVEVERVLALGGPVRIQV